MPMPLLKPHMSSPPKLGALASLRAHWPEYLMEAGLLGAFMVSACVFGALYEFPQSPVHQAIMSALLRRLLMGMSMGLTAIAHHLFALGKAVRRAYQPIGDVHFSSGWAKSRPGTLLFYMPRSSWGRCWECFWWRNFLARIV